MSYIFHCAHVQRESFFSCKKITLQMGEEMHLVLVSYTRPDFQINALQLQVVILLYLQSYPQRNCNSIIESNRFSAQLCFDFDGVVRNFYFGSCTVCRPSGLFSPQ